MTTTSELAPDTWYHVAFTFGSGGMKLFLDGVEVDTDSYTGGLGTTSGGTGNFEPIVLGASQMSSGDLVATNLNSFLAGRIGQLNIVDHALTAGEIASAGTAESAWTVYAVQNALVSPPVGISGEANINPNNSPQNEFEVHDGTTLVCDRDDLHKNANTDENGVFFEGHCTRVRLKPKGNGNQNSLIVDGQPYPLQNSNTYIFEGDMTVKVYNDHKHSNGKAMGKWWIEFVSGTIVLDDEVQLPDRLVKVDHKAGTVTEIMAVARPYDGLASSDGKTFFATADDEIYRIDTFSETETLVGSMAGPDALGLEFSGSTLTCFEIVGDSFGKLDTSTGGTLGTPSSVGMVNLGTMIFVPLDKDPAQMAKSYD